MKAPRLSWLCRPLLAIALALAAPADARMGGGHSYSGGSSSSHSSGSGSSRAGGGSFHWSAPSSPSRSGSAAYLGGGGSSGDSGPSFTLLLEIVVLALVIYLLYRLLAGQPGGGQTKTFRSASRGWDAPRRGLDEGLADLQARDENFSKVLFLDFASLLYHKFHSFRGTGNFRLIAPYLSAKIVEQTQGHAFNATNSAHAIVIGKARIANCALREQTEALTVEFEANLTLRHAGGAETRLANRERWTFERRAGLASPAPEQMRSLACPACGGPADFTDAGECPYCHTFIRAGEKQWQVADMRLLSTARFALENPAAYAEETGTDRPTVKQADLAQRQQLLLARHGLAEWDWDGFFGKFCEQVVKPYFLATYAAWSAGRWQDARHLVSDRLYEANRFWIEEYAGRGWHNRLENIEIQQIAPARIDLDKFYEAVTVRIHAACLDYTVDLREKVVGGSAKKPRRFSEYWTFIRAGGALEFAPCDVKTCPACGAPADRVGQAGQCGYCGAKLSEGRFSWVLAAIAQDEAYEG